MIELHYLPLNFKGKIPVEEFYGIDDMLKWILNNGGNDDAVYVLSTEMDKPNDLIATEVFISDMLLQVCEQFRLPYWQNPLLTRFFIFEMDSFEDAYKVALDMKELSPLCYSPENNNDEN